MEALFVGLLVVVALLIFLYNRMVALRQNRENAFADIDVQLKQRSDLIPNLVETVKGYATHEKGVLEEVTAARSRTLGASSVNDRIASEQQLSTAIGNLFAVAESYPDLKANTNFLALQSELSDIENKVAASRRYFNNATNEFNTATQQFPGVIIARMFGFKSEPFFDVGAEQRATLEQAPKVSFS